LAKLEERGPQFASLYDALAAQREKAASEAQERELGRFRPKGLNEEEAAFLEERRAGLEAYLRRLLPLL
jgi:hypothetical protein